MPVHSFVDWIAATLPTPGNGYDDCMAWGAELTYTDAKQWTPGKAANGYRYAADHPYGYRVMCGRADMGVHLIMPGQALQEGRKGQLGIEALIAALFRAGAKLTRVDVAIDATSLGLDIDALAKDYELHRYIGVPRVWHMEKSDKGGQTLYIGARTSDHYLRIYNKYAEAARHVKKPGVEDWKRVELENHGMAARAVGYDLRAGKDTFTVCGSHIVAVVDFQENPVWRQVMGTPDSAMHLSHRRLHHTEKWMLGAVAMAWARLDKSDPTFAARWIAAVAAARAALDKRAHDL
jgi:Replication initiation factor